MELHHTDTIHSHIKAKCGIIFFFMIIASIFVKTNLFRAFEEDIHDWLAFLPEALCVVVIYYIYLFWHAKKGIVLGVKVETAELENEYLETNEAQELLKRKLLDEQIIGEHMVALPENSESAKTKHQTTTETTPTKETTEYSNYEKWLRYLFPSY